MVRTLAHFPRNPDYGLGVYRRSLRFAAGFMRAPTTVRDFTGGVAPKTPPPAVAARLQGAGS